MCNTCAALSITCYFEQDKPEWMDGGPRQEEMAGRLKREVKDMAHRRRGECGFHSSGDHASRADTPTSKEVARPKKPPGHLATPVSNILMGTSESRYAGHNDTTEHFAVVGGTLDGGKAREDAASGWPDACLFMFYLENLLPFLFPFYRPSLLEGGRTWILDLMMSSPVVRLTALCQSSYFFSLALGTLDCDVAWQRMLGQTRDAFRMLRQSLQAVDELGIENHLHGAVRAVASIMQVQRFDIAVSSFENCQAHLSAVLALVNRILDSHSAVDTAGSRSSFDVVMNRLGPSSWTLPSQCIQMPSGEQAAFRFSLTLVILDDIIASTALQEQPKLYEYHQRLLSGTDGARPPINMETVVGCQNWVMIQIGEIAVLDAWKQGRKIAGNLDMMELVHRATAIKDPLLAQLTRLEADPATISKQGSSALDMFAPNYSQSSESPASQVSLVTRVWAHSAILYLFIVVSGWQPASATVRYRVGRITELLTQQMSPPALLRATVWPFCVAGCLAEPAQEACLRGMVEMLQPPSVFGTVRKALEIMENVWRHREVGASTRDLATCLRSQDGLVLLV